MSILVFLLILSGLTTISCNECPQGCECSGNEVNCSGLSSFPQLPIETTHLQIRDSTLPELSISKFVSLIRLTHVKLTKNHITTIQDLTFSNCTSLISLDLSNNHLTSIPTDLVRGLNDLKHLNLSHNELSFKDTFYIKDIKCSLETLDLSFNNLAELKDSFFHLFNKAEHIYLNNNKLGQLLYEQLSYFVDSLTTRYYTSIYLDNNQGDLYIDSHFFENVFWKKFSCKNSHLKNVSFLSNLKAEQIDLSGNHIDMTTFRFNDHAASCCKELSLRNNNISSLSNNLIKTFRYLKTLDLSHNNLKVLDIILSSLNHLDVSNNPDLASFGTSFQEISHSFTTLNMSFCFFHHFTSSTFSNLINLKNIDMSHNKIESLPAGMKKTFSKLHSLNVSYNFLHCNCKLKWLSDWMRTYQSKLQIQPLSCFSPSKKPFLSAEFNCHKPSIKSSSGTFTAFEGEDVKISCEAEADPIPEIDIIFPSGVHNVKRAFSYLGQTKRVQIITIKNVNKESEGQYRCEAWNDLGRNSSKWEIKVIKSLAPKVIPKPSNLPDFEIEILPGKVGKINTTTATTKTPTTTTQTTKSFKTSTITTSLTTSQKQTTRKMFQTIQPLKTSTIQRKTTIETTLKGHQTTKLFTRPAYEPINPAYMPTPKKPIKTKEFKESQSITSISSDNFSTKSQILPEQSTPTYISNTTSSLDQASAHGILHTKETKLILVLVSVLSILFLSICIICIIVFRRKRKREKFFLEKREAFLGPYRNESYDRRNRSNGAMAKLPINQDTINKQPNGMLLAKSNGSY